MISTLPPGLMQDQIPTVHGREEVLVLPVETKAGQVGFTGHGNHTVLCIVIHRSSPGPFKLSFIRTHLQVVKRSPQGPRAVLGPKPGLLALRPIPFSSPPACGICYVHRSFLGRSCLPWGSEILNQSCLKYSY